MTYFSGIKILKIFKTPYGITYVLIRVRFTKVVLFFHTFWERDLFFRGSTPSRGKNSPSAVKYPAYGPGTVIISIECWFLTLHSNRKSVFVRPCQQVNPLKNTYGNGLAMSSLRSPSSLHFDVAPNVTEPWDLIYSHQYSLHFVMFRLLFITISTLIYDATVSYNTSCTLNTRSQLDQTIPQRI